MSSELTNLLPSERIHAFRRDYFLRLGTIAAYTIALTVLVHGLLLVPTYLFLQNTVSLEKAHLAELTANLATSREGEMQSRLNAIKASSEQLLVLAQAPSSTAVIKTILGIAHPGVRITGFTFRVNGNEGKLLLTGVAGTREALRTYHQSLSQLSFAKSADLPLSAYAKETDIPFTITLTGSFTP